MHPQGPRRAVRAAKTSAPAQPDLRARLGPLRLPNPVTLASGWCGYAAEMAPFFDLNRLGGYALKGIFRDPRPGNPTPRFTETPAGMINSIGLEGVGMARFVTEKLPPLKGLKGVVIANISGNTVEEYAEVAARLSARDAARVDALEINLSCPNIKTGGVLFGIDPKMIRRVVGAVRAASHKPLLTKLTPNITRIEDLAEAALAAGSDGLSLINTVRATALNPTTGASGVATVVGGLSGPAIRPLAVRLVLEVRRAFPTAPILAMGGIHTLADALEFLRAGADVLCLGTASMVHPLAAPQMVDDLEKLLHLNGLGSFGELRQKLSAGETVLLP